MLIVNRRRLLHGSALASFLALTLAGGAATAQEATYAFNIPAEPLAEALRAFGVVTHQSLIFTDDLTASKTAPAVVGTVSARQALDRLLADSGLAAERTAGGSLIIRKKPDAPLAPTASRSDQPADALQEIVVTAQKRAEPIRSVPISMSAVSASDLAARHIQNFQDLSEAVPNLSFSSLGGEGLSNLQIRGISSQAGTATVSVYIDDVSLTARNLYSDGAAEPRVFDLDRIEVLRGPQGTLYGASALGGTIKFLTQQPVLNSFGGEAFAEGGGVRGGGGDWAVRGIVNLPLVTDRAALRVGVETGADAGYITLNPLDPGPAPVHDTNGNDWVVVKSALLLKASDQLSIKAAIFYQRYHSDDTDLVNLAAPNYVVTKGLREPGTDVLAVPSLTVNWDAGFADLTAVTGYYYRSFDRINDVSATNAQGLALSSIANPSVAAAVYDLKSANYLDTNINQVSEEIRLASKPYAPGGFPLTWLVGAYFSDERTHLFDSQPIFGINAAFAKYGQDPQNPADLSGGFPGDFASDLSYLATRTYQTNQYAVFGEATYHLGPAIRLTTGFRYVTAREVFDSVGNYYYSSCDPSVNGSGCPTTAHLIGDFHAFTPKFALGWDVTPRSTLYANITKGFRLGSENRPVPLYGDPDQNPNAPGANSTRADLKGLGLTSVPASYAPDSLWNYEVGSKSLLFAKRLALDVSLFYIRWTNIQQTIVLPTSGYDFEANAGDARSYGVEVASKLNLSHHIKLDASGGYTKATLDSGVVIDGHPINNTTAGEDVAGVPRWSGSAGAEYDTTIDGADSFVRGEASYVGRSHGTLVSTDPDYNRPDYAVFDASAGVTLNKYEFSLFAKNLTDNDRIIQRPNIRNAGVSLAYRLTPRVIGANVRVPF